MTQATQETQATTDDNDFGVIHKTTDYTKFMYMGGNRRVNLKHVRDLQNQMQRNREMFASLPILVNESWYIIDGQHRFEAAKALGFPVYYVRQKRVGLADARQLNIAQKRWSLTDFARSYADSGRNDYIELLRVKNNYPHLALSTVGEYLSGDAGGGKWTDEFRRGDYRIIDMEDGVAALDFLNEVLNVAKAKPSSAFTRALWKVIHHDDFDEPVFLKKLRESPDALSMAASSRACLRNIEEIYNKHNRIPVRLY